MIRRRIYAPPRFPRFIRCALIWRAHPDGPALFRARRDAWLPPSWMSDRRCMSLNLQNQRRMRGYVRPVMRHGIELYRAHL